MFSRSAYQWPALGAIALWASLSSLAVALAAVPPFLLTGLALLIGGLIGLPRFLREGSPPVWRVIALGIYGLFGFHFLLFLALRHAPALQANIVNYLWPLFIVILAPWFLPRVVFSGRYVQAAVLGFAGAVLAMLSGGNGEGQGGAALGYVLALGSALVWSSYSLLTQRLPAFSTSQIALAAVVSGLLSLLCHLFLEPPYMPVGVEWLWLLLMGLGPMGLAFYLWDAALKKGDPRHIGVLSYLTPLGSSLLLLWVLDRAFNVLLLCAIVCIVGAGWWSSYQGGKK